mmetsp:Transcript_26319/g.52480  ORF Transcript_26319/g.52480 Transcript_26319/m.52480 type:complete len:453 (+) Transcript_26319:177-1535(+)
MLGSLQLRLRPLPLLALLLFLLLSPHPSCSTEERCQMDCRAPPSLRILGPTRPNDDVDTIGNTLAYTRPHPYSQAPMEAAVVRFNSTIQMNLPSWNATEHSFGTFHKNYLLRALKKGVALEFQSDDLKIMSSTPVQESTPGDASTSFVVLSFFSEYVVDYTLSYNYSTTDEFVNLVLDKYESSANLLNVTSILQAQADMSPAPAVKSSLQGSGLALPAGYTRPTLANGELVEFMRLQTPNPNPFSKFCEAGCTFFFAGTPEPLPGGGNAIMLSQCTNECDSVYRSAAHITVGYSDLAEAARLECRDGCQIALARCRPGYRCTQAEMYEEGGVEKFTDGKMEICPPGKFRDFSYDQVTQCVDCPAGRYREDEKGRYMETCSQCPVGRYVNSTGSNSILDCLRCPAGRFGKFPGLALCACINEKTCITDPTDPSYFESPANAERRETFPFEGRW